eukprot:CAMPEP_0170957640 /NCGR_PEP_ID=MMETSP0735-20130129/34968_1 /TAXON_ID=186038 /ORGANISM="Fragilariopsis kerguelensis, Strain L26-C5" /LENGTH=79 /DNA_ID=CAMNT_0011370887 /DNA_START=375 /DNA_END=614 /DNA_ORIENTATION=+
MNFVTKTLDDSDMKLNSEDAIVSAIMDKTIHLDCVYFLLRRNPDILQKLLSPQPQPSSLSSTSSSLSSSPSSYTSSSSL